MKGVQCYELFGGIALKIHTFSFHFHYLMLFAALTNAVCLNNASFFSLICQMLIIFMLCLCLFHFFICIMHSAFNLFVFPNYMFTSLLLLFFLFCFFMIFFMKGL